MIPAAAILGFVTAERLVELGISRRNTRRLLARGAVERAAGHYPLIMLLHAAWLVGLWVLAWDKPVALPWAAVFVVLQVLRAWVLLSLGERWTTRIIVLPDEPLIATGPYKYLSHPNYLVVVGEIAVLPLAFELTWFAILFSVLNAGVLVIRIAAENRALRSGRPAAVADK